jgi:hypothetical protein
MIRPPIPPVPPFTGSGSGSPENYLLVVYDLRDDGAWRTANRHRNYWGKTHTHVHYLEENVVVLTFRPAPDSRWQAWEQKRSEWILGELEQSEAA